MVCCKPTGYCFLSVVLLITLFIAAGCEKPARKFECRDPLGCVSLAPGEPVRIGVLQSLSGKTATLGKEQIRGLELALEDRNGMLLGHPVVFQVEDTGCSPEGGANATLKIIADPKCVAIFGTTCSAAAAAASKAMSQSGLTMISGNNSAPFLTSIGGKRASQWHSGYFRTAANEENAGKAAARFVYETLGIRKSASVNDGDIYTRGLTQGFNSAFRALGGEVVLDGAVAKGDRNMAPLLTGILNAGARFLFFPLFQSEGYQILTQARQMPGFDTIPLMGGGALMTSAFIDDAGSGAAGMFFVGPAGYKGPSAVSMGEKYRRKYLSDPSVFYFLYAYDAASLLFHGIEAAAVTDAGGGLHIGRKALRETLYAVRNFDGVTGRLSCDPFGDCGVPAFNILQLSDPSKGIEGLKQNIKFTFTPE